MFSKKKIHVIFNTFLGGGNLTPKTNVNLALSGPVTSKINNLYRF